jgi:transcriptional regulator with XRE-family HTH domain
MPEPLEQLGVRLKARRREMRLSLRDLADQTGVSFNTLSRVERGHVPDLKNFSRIVDWLEIPPETFFDPTEEKPRSTPQAIARHLMADKSLSSEAASKIAEVVSEMYGNLASKPLLAAHLRSAKTFTPEASAKLAEVLGEMQSAIIND